MPWCLKNKQWYRRGGNMFPKKAFASPEKKSQNNRGVQTRRIPFKERRRRRSKKKKSGHKEQHEPFMFLAFHIRHRSPSSALEAVHVVSRLAAKVLRRLLLLLMLLLVHTEALRLAHVHAADHAAHVGV
jgi:hypothetical protein